MLRVQPLDVVIGDVTPAPQEGGELDVVLGSRGPNWLHIVLRISEFEDLRPPLASLKSNLLPPLHVFRAPLVIDVEESLAGTPGFCVDIAVIELVTHDTVGLGVQTW